MHTKHTNGPHRSWNICRNTIEMERGTFRGAGLHVKRGYKWKTGNMPSAYLCSETSLFDDFNTNTFESIMKYVKETRQKNTGWSSGAHQAGRDNTSQPAQPQWSGTRVFRNSSVRRNTRLQNTRL